MPPVDQVARDFGFAELRRQNQWRSLPAILHMNAGPSRDRAFHGLQIARDDRLKQHSVIGGVFFPGSHRNVRIGISKVDNNDTKTLLIKD